MVAQGWQGEAWGRVWERKYQWGYSWYLHVPSTDSFRDFCREPFRRGLDR